MPPVPIHYARSLTAPARSQRAIRHLGFALAFIAGASNAGGFLAVRQATVPLDAPLCLLAIVPALDDLRRLARRFT